MSDMLAQLYGRAAEPPPAPNAAELAARAIYNAGGGNYAMPDARPATVAPSEPAPSAPAVVPQPPAFLAPASPDQAAAALYGDHVMTRSNVDFAEAPAAAAALDLPSIPADLRLPDAEAAELEGRFRQGMEAAGAGVTLTRELFGDVIRASQGMGEQVPQEVALRQLQDRLGPGWEAKVEAARVLVDRVAAHYPEVRGILERTGLGDNPDFILKLVKRAGQGGRG